MSWGLVMEDATNTLGQFNFHILGFPRIACQLLTYYD